MAVAETPELLTLEESDRYRWLYAGDSLERARLIAEMERGILYTQVDAEMPTDRAYERGEHPVNRTGWYIVIVPGRGRRPSESEPEAPRRRRPGRPF